MDLTSLPSLDLINKPFQDKPVSSRGEPNRLITSPLTGKLNLPRNVSNF